MPRFQHINHVPIGSYHAYFSLSRNHNAIGQIDQDPGAWPEVAEISRNVLSLRYKYLPYLYTLFHGVRSSLHFGFVELLYVTGSQ